MKKWWEDKNENYKEKITDINASMINLQIRNKLGFPILQPASHLGENLLQKHVIFFQNHWSSFLQPEHQLDKDKAIKHSLVHVWNIKIAVLASQLRSTSGSGQEDIPDEQILLSHPVSWSPRLLSPITKSINGFHGLFFHVVI